MNPQSCVNESPVMSGIEGTGFHPLLSWDGGYIKFLKKMKTFSYCHDRYIFRLPLPDAHPAGLLNVITTKVQQPPSILNSIV